jgi:hypothetical protein
MSAQKPAVDPQAAPAPEKSARSQARAQERRARGYLRNVQSPTAQRVLRLCRRANPQSPVRSSGLTEGERQCARALVARGLVCRGIFPKLDDSGDDEVGYFVEPLPAVADDDEGHEPDAVADFHAAEAFAGDLAAMEADAARREL